jgi:hypothetical protein
MKIDNEQIAKLRKLCEVATEGPWYGDGGYRVRRADRDGEVLVEAKGLPAYDEGLTGQDAAFIAAAREAVPALLDFIEGILGANKGHIAMHNGKLYHYREYAGLVCSGCRGYVDLYSDDEQQVDQLRAALVAAKDDSDSKG